MERQFQPTLEDAMSRRIANLSIHAEDREPVSEEGARSPVGMYGDKGQGERLCSAKRQGAGGRSPTATTARWPGNAVLIIQVGVAAVSHYPLAGRQCHSILILLGSFSAVSKPMFASK